MKMERKVLFDALSLVKPALATKDLIEELTHVWFDGDYAMAYNDADLGIQVPLEVSFTGGVRGTLLLGLLQNSRARDVTIEPGEEGHLMLKASSTKAKLAVLDPERAVWQFPKPNKKKALTLSEELVDALRAVLVSVGNDTSTPEKLGVTIEFSKGGVDMYTTDSKTITHCHVDLDVEKELRGKRVIVPTAFCEQLLRLCVGGGFMEVRDDCTIAGNENGVLLYTRLLEATKPLDFAEVVKGHMGWHESSKFETPAKLELALERALVLFEGLPSEPVSISVDGGKLRVVAEKEGRGKLNDSMSVSEGAPGISIMVEPAMLKRALSLTTHIVMDAASVKLLGDGIVYIAATR